MARILWEGQTNTALSLLCAQTRACCYGIACSCVTLVPRVSGLLSVSLHHTPAVCSSHPPLRPPCSISPCVLIPQLQKSPCLRDATPRPALRNALENDRISLPGVSFFRFGIVENPLNKIVLWYKEFAVEWIISSIGFDVKNLTCVSRALCLVASSSEEWHQFVIITVQFPRVGIQEAWYDRPAGK